MSEPSSQKTYPPGEIRAVIFDLGGVILRTEDFTPRARLAEQMGLTLPQLEEIVFNHPISRRAEEGQATAEEVWEQARSALNLPPEEVRAFRRAFFAGDRVDVELVAFIRSLRPAFRTALLSNTWVMDLPRFLEENLNIPTGVFDVVVSSAKFGAAKPRPEVYRAVLEQVGVQPHQAVFVDDSERNITGAQAVGLRTVHFRGPTQAREELLRFLHIPG